MTAMLLKSIVIAFCAVAHVTASPQLGGFLNSVASDALGFGQSIMSDISPNTQPPQPPPTPSSPPAIATSAVPSPSPRPKPSTPSPSPSPRPQVTSAAPSSSPAPTTSPSPVVATPSFTSYTSSTSSRSSTISKTPHKTSSQTSSSVSSSPTLSTTLPVKSSSQASRSNGPAIAAAVILSILGVTTVLGLVWFFIRRRNKRLAAGLDEHKDDSRSWNSKAPEDDENPAARYDVAVPSYGPMVQKPLPAVVAQRKYLPYRPQQFQQSPVSSFRKTEPSVANSNISDISEIDGRAVEMAPVELEGCTPPAKVEPLARNGTQKTVASETTQVRSVRPGSVKDQPAPMKRNSGAGKPADEGDEDVEDVEVTRGPLVVRNN